MITLDPWPRHDMRMAPVLGDTTHQMKVLILLSRCAVIGAQ